MMSVCCGRFVLPLVLVLPASLHAQTVIRQFSQSMPTAKITSIPDFVLPEKYKDRTVYRLPAAVNHETDTASSKYMPPLKWSISTNACGCASAVSFDYDYAVQSYLKLVTTNPTLSSTKPYFPYNYAFHFLNPTNRSTDGDSWMFVESFDILKETGCPTTTDFGSFNDDQRYHWMSGYDKYYKAMKLRVDQYFKIDLGPASADTLVKQIVYDYADGSPAGGLLTFQVNSSSMPTTTISGRRTISSLGPGGGHALTICGYDDAFQGGSWLVQTSWGNGDTWCPYRLLRSTTVWYNNPANNKYAMFCRIKKNYTPKYTFKVNLTHSMRNQICIMTGVANSRTATAPTRQKDYAGAFNYAGGPAPLAGLGLSSTLEIGLDLTDFAADVANGQGTFFLKIISKGGIGQVNSLALMDYTGTTVKETACKETNKAIAGTILMAVPFSAATALNDPMRGKPDLQPAGLTTTFNRTSGLMQFEFPAEDGVAYRLHIVDLRGRSVYAKSDAATAAGGRGRAIWDRCNSRGQKAGPGPFVVSISAEGRGATARSFCARVMAEE